MSKRYAHMWRWLAAALLLAAAAPLLPWRTLAVSGEPRTAPTLIIDAGHGGADGGAVAPDGTPESEINLDIALRLEALAGLCGVRTVMTRRGEEIDYPPEARSIAQMKKADQNARLALINGCGNAVLLSIHQNDYPAESPNGIQVFYNRVADSAGFAKTLQENLTAALCPENRRVAEAADEGIYLMRRADCPAVLAECGFLSNPNDLKKLESESYRTSLAVVMLASWLQYTRGASV